jgi:hypothetical protein
METHIRRGWTAEDVEKLKRLAGKRPRAEIASELGRTPGSLAVKAHELKISLKVEKMPAGGSHLSGVEAESAVPDDNPVFSVRSLDNGADYVIDVLWSDGATDQLGFFASPEDAVRWINDDGESWLRDRLGITIH